MPVTSVKPTPKIENDNSIALFVMQPPTIAADETGLAASEIFSRDSAAEGIVVLDNKRPVGIMMRTSFFQKMGSQYGHSLYANRSVRLIMDAAFMSAEFNESISKISMQAMSREQGKLYDYIVVTKDRAYCGVISIRHFLIELSKQNDAQISILKEQQKKLISANEQEMRFRQEIEQKSSSLKNLLDHADQGFLSFARDLVIQSEYSYKCYELFQKSISGVSFIELIADYFDEERLSVFSMVFENYYNNNASVTDQVYLMLLPSDCVVGDRHVHLEYRRIEVHGEKAVMVILSDSTEKRKLEKEITDDQNKQRLLIKAFSYPVQIKQTMEDFHELADGGYQLLLADRPIEEESAGELLRAVHTFKGDFAQFGFLTASEKLHGIENALIDAIENGEGAARLTAIMETVDAEAILEDDLNTVYDVLGSGYFDQSEKLSISKDRLDEIKRGIEDGSIPMRQDAILEVFSGFERKSIKVYLEQYADYLEYISARLMKSKPVYLIEGDEVDLHIQAYKPFLKSLVHVFRNSVDHGLETDEERAECGKPENGLIVCRVCRLGKEAFRLSISDDGRGIDLDKVIAKALQNNICTAQEIEKMTEEKLVSLIFADRFSTKDTADSLSGRGVGMAAVMQSCLALGGRMDVTTQKGRGTTFTFELPIITQP